MIRFIFRLLWGAMGYHFYCFFCTSCTFSLFKWGHDLAKYRWWHPNNFE